MEQFGELYSSYYDLLNGNKLYIEESDYIESLIKEYSPTGSNLLDLGCGTGKHAIELSLKGFDVDGYDISKFMIGIAKKNAKELNSTANFHVGDIRALHLDKKYPIVLSLFHVMCYQNSNKDLLSVFKSVSNILFPGGIFIFDFWYGPAVLTEKPEIRIKKIETKDFLITRLATPQMRIDQNITDVNYEILIENKKDNVVRRKYEKHSMRYLFDPELESICRDTGFEILEKSEWMSRNKPDLNTWNVVWTLKKK